VSVDYRQLASRLCASIFADATIQHARAHHITGPFVVESHAHDDLLQFDWMVGCRGVASIDGHRTNVDGCTFMLVAPRRPHAMALQSASPDAKVFHVRIALPGDVAEAFARASTIVTRQPANRSLEAALTDVWRLTVGARGQSLLRIARLAEAIALWPGASDTVAEAAKPRAAVGLDRDLDAALQLMERSLLNPPTLDELADAAHLSVRHFTRRFREALGLAPMEYLDRKRLGLAQQMIAYESSNLTDVADRMGFSSPAVFSRWFSNLAGETPSDYRSRPHAL
jgi:AraC family transcriptional regulator